MLTAIKCINSEYEIAPNILRNNDNGCLPTWMLTATVPTELFATNGKAGYICMYVNIDYKT